MAPNIGNIFQNISPAAQVILAKGICVVAVLIVIALFLLLCNKERTGNGVVVIDAVAKAIERVRRAQPPESEPGEECSEGPDEPAA